MDPVTAVLAAASAAGAIFGGARKHINVDWLREKFGAKAVTDEALQLFHSILNSPAGQKIMSSAAEQGQQFARDTNQRAAQAGLAGPEGTSGTGIFATSAAEGASSAAQRDTAAGFYQSALPIAQQMVGERMQAYLNDFAGGGVSTPAADLWQRVGNAAGTVGAMLPQKQTNPSGPGSNVAMEPSGAYTPRVGNPPETPLFSGMDIRRRQPSTAPVLPMFSRLQRFPTSFNAVQPGGQYASRF